MTPDLARPDSEIVGRLLHVAPERMPTCAPNVGVTYVTCNPDVLYPDLTSLVDGRAAATCVCDGRAGDWRDSSAAPRVRRRAGAPQRLPRNSAFGALQRLPRNSAFGAPSFLFERVEIVGFRTELAAKGGRPARDLLRDLIAPLNFHIAAANASGEPADFRYEAASATIVIELLRYGVMRTRNVRPPFRPDDFMSQHELIARILVGRVDDDTSQGREAATFVPAIFVDNPWSKAVGRLLQGFPKVLASFCTPDGPLDMDGCLRGGSRTPEPLHRVNEVHLVERPDRRSADTMLLDSRTRAATMAPVASSGRRRPCPSWRARCSGGRHGSSSISTKLSSGDPSPATSWRGGSTVTDRSEISPVDDRMNLPKVWISGRLNLFDVEVAFPTGVATLQMNVPPSASRAWKSLCQALGGYGEALGFPTGDWYRLKCSMELDVDDALRW